MIPIPDYFLKNLKRYGVPYDNYGGLYGASPASSAVVAGGGRTDQQLLSTISTLLP